VLIAYCFMGMGGGIDFTLSLLTCSCLNILSIIWVFPKP